PAPRFRMSLRATPAAGPATPASGLSTAWLLRLKTQGDRTMTRARRRISGMVLAVGVLVAPAMAGDPVALSAPGEALLKRALGPDAAPARAGGGRSLFEAVLASDAFRSGSAGPFDVHVLVGEGGMAATGAAQMRDTLQKTLEPASALVSRLWPKG